jgi:serine/threonine protein kinase
MFQKLHKRLNRLGFIHRDIKPDNLLLDAKVNFFDSINENYPILVYVQV